MATFQISGAGLPALTEGEKLIDLLGEEGYDASKVNKIVTLADIDKHFSGVIHPVFKSSYPDLVRAYLYSIVPDYSEAHPVNSNLGVINKANDSFIFWGSAVYYDPEEGLYLSIGGRDKANDLEPYHISFEYDEDMGYYSTPKVAPNCQHSWQVDSVDQMDNTVRYNVNYQVFNPKSPLKTCKSFSVWVKLAKADGDDKDTSREIATGRVTEAVYDATADLSLAIGNVPTGGGTIAKSGQIFSSYYAQKKLSKIAFKVVGVDTVTRTNAKDESFTQIQAYVDFSDMPGFDVLAVDFTPGVKTGKVVPLNEVTMIQFNTGKSSKPSPLMEKYLALESKRQEVEGGLSTWESSDIKPPTPEAPWVIEYAEIPRESTHTPKYNVWTRFVPNKVRQLLERAKDPKFLPYVSIDVTASADYDSTIPVTATPVKPVTAPTVADDDMSSEDF